MIMGLVGYVAMSYAAMYLDIGWFLFRSGRNFVGCIAKTTKMVAASLGFNVWSSFVSMSPPFFDKHVLGIIPREVLWQQGVEHQPGPGRVRRPTPPTPHRGALPIRP